MKQNLRIKQPKLHKLNFGSADISFSLVFSQRKTLAISVCPDTSVVVVAPEGEELKAIRARVRKRASWIIKQKHYFSKFLPKQPPRRFVSGETHKYLGKQYRLKVRKGAPERVLLKGGCIWVSVNDIGNNRRIGTLLAAWYRERAEHQFEASFTRCSKVFSISFSENPELKIKQMPKRWGSCTSGGVIYLNPALVKAPKRCIDYVMTHELCHLKHRKHGKDYFRLLKKVMPDWEERKQELEAGAAL